MTADFQHPEEQTYGHGSTPLTPRVAPSRLQVGHRGNEPGPQGPGHTPPASGADGAGQAGHAAFGSLRLLVGRADDRRDAALRGAGQPERVDDRAETRRLLAAQLRRDKADRFHDQRADSAPSSLNRAFARWDHLRSAVRDLPDDARAIAWEQVAAALLITVREVRKMRTSHADANARDPTRPGATHARTREHHTQPGYAT